MSIRLHKRKVPQLKTF